MDRSEEITEAIHDSFSPGVNFSVDSASHSAPGKAFHIEIQRESKSERYFLKFSEGRSENVYRSFISDSGDRIAVEALRKERHILDSISHQLPDPVPRVIDHQLDAENGPCPYLILEYMDGINLRDAIEDLTSQEYGDVLCDLGRILARVHNAVQFDSFGQITVENDYIRVVNSQTEWLEWVNSTWAESIEQLQTGPFTDLIPMLEDWYGQYADSCRDCSSPVLIHGDFHPGNILVDSSTHRDPVIVDWEDALVGPREYQLARAQYLFIERVPHYQDNRNELIDQFRSGYTTEHPMEFDSSYRSQRPIYQILPVVRKMGYFEELFGAHPQADQRQIESNFRAIIDQVID